MLRNLQSYVTLYFYEVSVHMPVDQSMRKPVIGQNSTPLPHRFGISHRSRCPRPLRIHIIKPGQVLEFTSPVFIKIQN